MMGYTDPIASAACSGRSACCVVIANLTMRTCKKRSRGNHTFCTAQDSRQVCLFHLETRGHAENILVPKEPPAMHAPVLHFARLRYDTPLNHATCASALLKIATPRTYPSKPHRIAPNDFDLIVEWLNTRKGEVRHRLLICRIGISDKRSAITLNHVGEHNYAHHKVCLSPILWRCWRGEVNKQSSFSAGGRFSVLLCWRGHRSLSLAWELPRLPLHLQAGFRACWILESLSVSNNQTLRY